MEILDIKKQLCYYDKRHPDYDYYTEDYCEEDKQVRNEIREQGKCSCDNCFYKRSKLAEELLKYRKLIRSVKSAE